MFRNAEIVALTLALAGCAGVPTVIGRAGYAQIELAGAVAVADSDGAVPTADPVDIVDDLGLDGGGAPIASIELATTAATFRVSGLTFRDSGQGVLSSAFGQIQTGVPVESELALDNVQAFWGLELLEPGPLRIAPGIGLDWFSVDTQVASITPVQVIERVRVRAPVPMLFLDASYEIGGFRPRVVVGGMKADLGDASGTFWDLDASVDFSPIEAVQLFAGYRWLSIDADGTSDGQRFDANVELRGWMAGGGLRF